MKTFQRITLKDGTQFTVERNEPEKQEDSNLLSIITVVLPLILFTMDYLSK